jgi:hypothetical protein
LGDATGDALILGTKGIEPESFEERLRVRRGSGHGEKYVHALEKYECGDGKYDHAYAPEGPCGRQLPRGRRSLVQIPFTKVDLYIVVLKKN